MSKFTNKAYKLPEDFIFGGATAAYQAEGSTDVDGKGKVAWDDFLEEQGRFLAEPASDFYNKYPIDLELSEKFGVNGVRISIAWSRIYPDNSDEINPKGVQFYHDVIDECLKRDIVPFITLHHFDTPEYLHSEGDFLNPITIKKFVEFCKTCFKEYDGKVKHWTTFNEIYPVASGQYLSGTFPPGLRFDYSKVFQSMHNMMYAHALVVNHYKEHYNNEIGIVHSLETRYPLDNDNEKDHHAAFLDDVLANKFLLDATFLGEYSDETMAAVNEILEANNGSLQINKDEMKVIKEAAKSNDFLGINYYQSHFVEHTGGDNNIFHNGTGDKGTSLWQLKGIGKHSHDHNIPRNDWDWLIFPEGLFDMMIRIKEDYPNYNKIYITENGLGFKDKFDDGIILDQERIDYVKDHLKAVAAAIDAGVNVKGYFLWSLMDVFSWSNGYNKRYGLFYIDFETQERYPKQSAYWWKSLSENKKLY